MTKERFGALGLAAACLLAAAACGRPEGASLDGAKGFEPGQVWRYKTRPGEEGSLLHIGAVDDIKGARVYGVKLTGLKFQSAGGKVSPVFYHLPLTEKALRASVTERVEAPVDLDGFVSGYKEWRRASEQGFDEPVAAVLNDAESLFRSAPPR